jgi:hypothetical protein
MPLVGTPSGRFTAQVTVFMFVPLRTAFMVMAAISASSVAPAQVNPAAEPLPAQEWTPLPDVIAGQLLQESIDPLAPAPEAEEAQPQQDEIEPGATLAETVAKPSSEPGTHELECLAGAIYFEARAKASRASWRSATCRQPLPRALSGQLLRRRIPAQPIQPARGSLHPRASQDWRTLSRSPRSSISS